MGRGRAIVGCCTRYLPSVHACSAAIAAVYSTEKLEALPVFTAVVLVRLTAETFSRVCCIGLPSIDTYSHASIMHDIGQETNSGRALLTEPLHSPLGVVASGTSR